METADMIVWTDRLLLAVRSCGRIEDRETRTHVLSPIRDNTLNWNGALTTWTYS
jgi:hypothetical protein